MPKLRKEKEDKVIELLEEGYSNVEISEKVGLHRKTVAKRRKEWENRKQSQEEPEKLVQQEQKESSFFEQQISTLIRYQGTNSREEAILQAILTQKSFNPYLQNHGLNSPSELISFFELKIDEQEERIEYHQASAERYFDRLIEIQLKPRLE